MSAATPTLTFTAITPHPKKKGRERRCQGLAQSQSMLLTLVAVGAISAFGSLGSAFDAALVGAAESDNMSRVNPTVTGRSDAASFATVGRIARRVGDPVADGRRLYRNIPTLLESTLPSHVQGVIVPNFTPALLQAIKKLRRTRANDLRTRIFEPGAILVDGLEEMATGALRDLRQSIGETAFQHKAFTADIALEQLLDRNSAGERVLALDLSKKLDQLTLDMYDGFRFVQDLLHGYDSEAGLHLRSVKLAVNKPTYDRLSTLRRSWSFEGMSEAERNLLFGAADTTGLRYYPSQLPTSIERPSRVSPRNLQAQIASFQSGPHAMSRNIFDDTVDPVIGEVLTAALRDVQDSLGQAAFRSARLDAPAAIATPEEHALRAVLRMPFSARSARSSLSKARSVLTADTHGRLVALTQVFDGGMPQRQLEAAFR